MNTNTTRFRQIFSRLRRGKEYREAFVDSEIAVGIPYQIRAMREAREWTQKELAERSGKKQSVISQLESPGYGRLSLTSLKRLAAAFDVGLMVRFVPFSELAGRASHLSVSDLEVPSFEEDQGLNWQPSSSDETGFLFEDSSGNQSMVLGERRPAQRAAPLYGRTPYGSYYDRAKEKTNS